MELKLFFQSKRSLTTDITIMTTFVITRPTTARLVLNQSRKTWMLFDQHRYLFFDERSWKSCDRKRQSYPGVQRTIWPFGNHIQFGRALLESRTLTCDSSIHELHTTKVVRHSFIETYLSVGLTDCKGVKVGKFYRSHNGFPSLV